uniref:Uncharacterized protein n=1 Tax=Eutreptiella gymnastica TaxID=73025 RepID=A0A6U7UKN3_9EUGL|mmetsp:Transcript_124440/g.215666  ORF Transcript_124440/g.215666 Transcript_124440/m.215666 type:complete len:105 (+) Transcript_124440:191-505(+)
MLAPCPAPHYSIQCPAAPAGRGIPRIFSPNAPKGTRTHAYLRIHINVHAQTHFTMAGFRGILHCVWCNLSLSSNMSLPWGMVRWDDRESGTSGHQTQPKFQAEG